MSAHVEISASGSCMAQLSPFREDVDPRDLPALRDLVRFGLMTDDQLARRYTDPDFALARLDHLKLAGIVTRWLEVLEGARIYEPTRVTRLIARVPGAHPRKPKYTHLVHDIGLVDLADALIAEAPNARFVAESQVRAFLDRVAPTPRRNRGDAAHPPDGLLVEGNSRIAIELELTEKIQQRYARISAWFVREWRIDRVRWYVDNPRILERLRQVNALHGFDRDMRIDLLPLPPGVRIRERQGRYEP